MEEFCLENRVPFHDFRGLDSVGKICRLYTHYYSYIKEDFMERYDVICDEGIDLLMDIFYARIRSDQNGVGDIFNNAVGTSDEKWSHHKKKIGEFWRGMLLGTGNFRGNPPQAHMALPPFPPEYFDIWLDLFEESLNQVFTEKPAAQILQRAQMIAMGFKTMLYK